MSILLVPKTGNWVGFGLVGNNQTHARSPYQVDSPPMTRPMGLVGDPMPAPIG
jgi:hypothetical protein